MCAAAKGRVDIHGVGLVAPDVLEQVLDVCGHVEMMRIVRRVVRPGRKITQIVRRMHLREICACAEKKSQRGARAPGGLAGEPRDY